MSNETDPNTTTRQQLMDPPVTETNEMLYPNAAGEIRKKSACSQCVERYGLSDEERIVMDKSFTFHALAEKFSVEAWQDYSGMHGSSDYRGMQYLYWLAETMRTAPGLYAVQVPTLRAVRGSMHIALAAGILASDERAVGVRLLDTLNRFGAHLRNEHRDLNGLRVDRTILDLLEEPDYVGDITPEWAWLRARDLAGKSRDEIEGLFGQWLKDYVEDFRANVATIHDGAIRESELDSVTRQDVVDAVAIIEKRADSWHQEVRTADACVILLNLSCEVYELTAKINAWVGIASASEMDAPSCDRIYQAIERISDLIDWEECENLRRFRDARRASQQYSWATAEPTMTVGTGGQRDD